MIIKLYELAHSRVSDKGNTLTLPLIPYRPDDYSLLCERVTAEAMKRHLGAIVAGEVVRYELPNLPALQFVSPGALLGASRPRWQWTRTVKV